MSNIASSFGMDEALKQLGIKDVNHGTSTSTFPPSAFAFSIAAR
jgi:hypothetical protein